MKRRLLQMFLLLLIGPSARGQGQGYTIEPYEATFFYGFIISPEVHSPMFYGITVEGDSTIVDASSPQTVWRSLFHNARYAERSRAGINLALDMLYPHSVNTGLASDINREFGYQAIDNERHLRFRLASGEMAEIYYMRIKGLYIPVSKNEWQQTFADSVSAQYPIDFDEVYLFFYGFLYSQSDHRFIISNALTAE